MKKRKKRIERRRAGLQFESGAFLRSSREITVCGCKKILHYAPNTVRLLLSDLIMEVCGEGITASTYFGREIKLSGRIETVRLSDDGFGKNNKSECT